ncbi:MAG: hypothetical protein LBV67_06050 [Streptococcaceae bacterium]|jgi:hypothetical protein|nr:hypothetical protein [Streptococcaceae bacterium]
MTQLSTFKHEDGENLQVAFEEALAAIFDNINDSMDWPTPSGRERTNPTSKERILTLRLEIKPVGIDRATVKATIKTILDKYKEDPTQTIINFEDQYVKGQKNYRVTTSVNKAIARGQTFIDDNAELRTDSGELVSELEPDNVIYLPKRELVTS